VFVLRVTFEKNSFALNAQNHDLVEHAPPKLVGWVRFPTGSYRRLQKRYLRLVQPARR